MQRKRKGQNRGRYLPWERVTACFLVALLAVSAGILFPNSIRTTMAEDGNNGLSKHIIDTVSPSHVKFNLFDYWMVERDSTSADKNRPVQGGINQGHCFLFGGMSGWGPWNVWTGNANHYNAQEGNPGIRYGEYKGVVQDLLQDGYPVLDLVDDTTPDYNIPSFMKNNPELLNTRNESLAYLFDPEVENEYRAVYENVQGLVKYDNNGGYVYSSHDNYAAFQESESGTLGTNGEPSAGYFDVYDNWALHGTSSPDGQFFPFDGADEVFETNPDGTYREENGKLVPNGVTPTVDAKNLNHFMGMTMETVFLQPEDGKIDQNTPMSFSFSGDDDVWIFIDNVLVSDLGGVHDECFTVIDFETGMVYTGLTPVVHNKDGSFTEEIPTSEELRTAGTDGKTWTWYNRANQTDVSGTYDEFAAAHGIQAQSLREIFTAAGQDGYQTWGDESGMSPNTFDQNTQHELKMFYLERGAGASNLVLSFNMLAVPASGVTKTDQDGRPVAGAEFALWPAQVSETEKDQYGYPAPVIDEETGLYVADKSGGEPICTSTTDQTGHLNFITENHKIISFQERAQNESNPQFYYVLEEIQRPVGYRSKGDISLYYSMYNTTTREGVLLSYNFWQTGAYSQAKLDVTMTNELYRYELDENGEPVAKTPLVPKGENETEYLDNGIIFAVPIKRMDMEGSLYDEENFCATYGTANTGWSMMSEPISEKSSVLEAAKNMQRVMQETRQTGTILAGRNARQLFHLEITNIPGDVQFTYPYLMETDRVNESQYNIAFYFAPNADSLEDITDPNEIVRIATATPNGDSFQRQYASQFYVSNTFNRVRVQKLDYQGDRLADAQFSMYQTYSYQDRDGEGSQYVWDDTAQMYRNTAVVNEDGTLKSRSEILDTTAWDVGKTIATGATGAGGLNLDGAILFPTKFDKYIYQEDQSNPYRVDPNDTSTYMEEGQYVIFETDPPAGYDVNETPIVVTVNDEGVFADAGQRNDGVLVGQYAGWILNSMSQFATEGAVDETLTFVKTNLKVQGQDGQLQSPIEGDITCMNKYSNENDRYIYFAEDVGQYVTFGRNLYQHTDEGTPRLVITQNNDVAAKAIIFDGKYANYNGLATVNKKNADGTIYSLQGVVTDGTLGFWLRKPSTAEGEQTFDSIQIDGTTLTNGVDYQIYTPNIRDLSSYDDLSHLFSVETLVQVFDQGYGSLSVTKETENVPDGSSLQDERFHFRVYSVFEEATKIVLAKIKNGQTLVDPVTGQPEIVDFNGTLNVRLREKSGANQSYQDTVINVAVDFVDGVGNFYLPPDHNVEYVYIPENRDHPAYQGLSQDTGLVGLVETKITLEDSTQSGSGVVIGTHVAFPKQKQEHTITFTNGVGTLYRNPDYTVTEVTVNGQPCVFTADDRFQYATTESTLDVPVYGEVDAVFTESDGTLSDPDRVVVNDKLPPEDGDFSSVVVQDGEVTVYQEGKGYKIAYNMSSNTAEKAVVAQFALYAGQTITVNSLPAGATYYVYEYAAGQDGSRTDLEDWDTEIDWQGNDYEVIEGYRAVKGTIALGDQENSTQKVTFTNSAKVGQLCVSKTVTGDQATDTDRQQKFAFTVTLHDKNGTPLQGTYSYIGGAIDGVMPPANGTLTLDDNGSDIIYLCHGQNITIQKIPDGASYQVEETAADGYTVLVGEDEDGDRIGEGIVNTGQTSSVAFTNIKQSTLAFTKIAAEDKTKPLSGAEFTLYQLLCNDSNHNHENDIVTDAGDCWKFLDTQTSGSNGQVTFPQLEANSQYRLVETKAPDGRVLPAGQWQITTDETNLISISLVTNGAQKPPSFAVDDNGGLLLPNSAPVDIPSSGGYGARPFLIIGGMLMLAAVAFVFMKKLYGKHTASK